MKTSLSIGGIDSSPHGVCTDDVNARLGIGGGAAFFKLAGEGGAAGSMRRLVG